LKMPLRSGSGASESIKIAWGKSHGEETPGRLCIITKICLQKLQILTKFEYNHN